MLINNGSKGKNIEADKIGKLELKNLEELLSLEKLIVLFEDINRIEDSNFNFIKKILEDLEFKTDTIIGNLGIICKSYFESYCEIKKKKVQNLKKIIELMKLKSSPEKNKKEMDDFIIVYNNNNSPNENDKLEFKFIYQEEILEIIDSLSLLKDYNNELDENFDLNISKKINSIKEMENFKELELLREIKEEKSNFENKINDICNLGKESQHFNEVKNILLNDNSDEQTKINWMLKFCNNLRASLSSVNESVYNALKELFDIIIDKLSERKIYDLLDLTIILIQTFSTTINNNNLLLEDEFKGKKIFQNKELWRNIILSKLEELIQNINYESKDNKSKEYYNYVRDNLKPIFLSFIFSMKSFNVPEEDNKNIIKEICNMEKYSQYNFNVDELMMYA